MEDLLEILRDLHPEVDFETCEELIDSKILDSFDIASEYAIKRNLSKKTIWELSSINDFKLSTVFKPS